MSSYTLSIETSSGNWERFVVPKEVSTYVKQLEMKVKLGFDQDKFDANVEKVLAHIENSPLVSAQEYGEDFQF